MSFESNNIIFISDYDELFFTERRSSERGMPTKRDEKIKAFEARLKNGLDKKQIKSRRELFEKKNFQNYALSKSQASKEGLKKKNNQEFMQNMIKRCKYEKSSDAYRYIQNGKCFILNCFHSLTRILFKQLLVLPKISRRSSQGRSRLLMLTVNRSDSTPTPFHQPGPSPWPLPML